jgi:predicted dehydrogenase
MKPVEAVIIGAGHRGRDVAGYFASLNPDKLKFIAVAEPDEYRRNIFGDKHNIPPKKRFKSYEDLLAESRMAPLCFNFTMDKVHFPSSLAVMEKGYHLFLEKPMAVTPEDCMSIQNEAVKRNLMVHICHPLRYTPVYKQIKELLDKDSIGKIISFSMTENVAYWHYAHSFVRGNWGVQDKCGPFILTKCCHDMDIAVWITDEKVRNVSSVGSLSYFREENAPKGAPLKCTDGCPAQTTCPFNAITTYVDGPNEWPFSVVTPDPTPEGRLKALKEGPYGRCVFRTDNDIADHQIVCVEFANGVSLDFTVRANTYHPYRSIRIIGTKGELNSHIEKPEISIDRFQQGIYKAHVRENHYPDIATGSHGGGDFGAINNFLRCYSENDFDSIYKSLDIAVEGHLLAFAAEEARVTSSVVNMENFKKSITE